MKKSFFFLSATLIATGLLAGCKARSVAQTPLAKINMGAWQYNADDNVYWQVGIPYAATPADASYETLGIFVPGAYFDATKNQNGTYTVKLNKTNAVSGYTAQTAPFVMPIETPGYAALAAPTDYVSAVKDYTDAGFIFVFAGARGRDHGAPAGVTDFKAAIRYVRANADRLPGDTARYFTYGMSGGGAQSAVLGATGDAPEYKPYLAAIGAEMNQSDAVLGSMDWCPITNLNVADEAYEWELGMARSGLDAETQAISDALAKRFGEYISALGLKDEDGDTLSLEHSADGLYHAGSYYDYLKKTIETSLNNFLSDTTFPYNPADQKAALDQKMLAPMPMMLGQGATMGDRPPRGDKPNGMPQGDRTNEKPHGAPDFAQMDNVQRNATTGGVTLSGTYDTVESYIDALNANGTWVIYDKATNTATISSVKDFMCAVKLPSKNVGAFDDLNKTQGENTLFGYNAGAGAHFDAFMVDILADINAKKAAEYAADLNRKDALGFTVDYRANMYNPMYYLSPYYEGYKTAHPAKYWRIRTGIFQGDTAISTELAYTLALRSYGDDIASVDFATVWGLGHVEAERTGATTPNFIAWVNDCVKDAQKNRN